MGSQGWAPPAATDASCPRPPYIARRDKLDAPPPTAPPAGLLARCFTLQAFIALLEVDGAQQDLGLPREVLTPGYGTEVWRGPSADTAPSCAAPLSCPASMSALCLSSGLMTCAHVTRGCAA